MKLLEHYDRTRGSSLSGRARTGLMRSRLTTAVVGMAAAALYVRYQTKRAEKENPPSGKFVEVDGVTLHYVEKGEGQPLVLLHGNNTMGMDFTLSEVFDRASERYRVIVFDRPGYGYSERPRSTIWTAEAQAKLLHAALQKIGADQPIVLGHSWGALVAMALGLDFPQSVRSLILMSGYYYPTARPDIPFASQPAIPIIGDLMRYTISPILFRMTWPLMLKKKLFAPAPVPEHFKRFPPWMAFRPLQLRATAAEMALAISDSMKLRKRYQELSVPLVIVAGSEDRLVYFHKHSARLYAQVPGCDLRLVKGSGHMVHHLEPDQVMEAIEAAAANAGGNGLRSIASSELEPVPLAP